ncbi:protocadherin-20 [Puntigrus tetrazona]|uniref:protocadherin-20 n=1 Tax=Puntigrus tetrazona TaxID=1606681 RepID=UPI001C8A04B0|nr:protocadherin-20 [Puntigrus tetrazona]
MRLRPPNAFRQSASHAHRAQHVLEEWTAQHHHIMNHAILQWVLLLAFAEQIHSRTLHFTIPEEQEAGVKIGSLSTTYLAPYRLLDERYIRVDESTGDLFTKERIDRETLCPSHQDGDCVFSDTAVVSIDHEVVPILILVDDINDNAPVFERNVIPLHIPEDASIGTAFPLDDQAQDKDTGDNGAIRYYLEDSGGFFNIRQDRHELELVVQRQLDRETRENHLLVLVAADGGSVPLSATANLNVTVTDVDDNCPEFDADSPTAAIVPALGVKGTVVAQLKATDKDLGQNAQITFSFSRQISDRAKVLFHMHGHTGLISLAVDTQLDSPEEHTLKVFANSPLCPPAQTQVTVYMQPAMSPEPSLKIKFVAEHKNRAIVLQENEPPTVLALLELEDTSKGTLSLDKDSVPFSLKPQAGSYLLSTSKPLDFEMCGEYEVTVIISDPHDTRLHRREVIKVLVEDVNDNAPKFEQARYETDIRENNEPGAFLLRVQASDADSHQFGKVRYRLTNGGPFTIDEERGVISVVESLDRELQETYVLTVLARDGGEPSQEGFANVVVNILDLNDNPPAFPTPHFYFFVSESIPQLSQVGKVSVSDSDKGENGRIADVRILNDEVPFAIDLLQGSLRSIGEVDREKQDRYELLVVAVDGGSPVLSATARMTIFIEDVNDNQPQVLLPSSNLSCLTISPATRAGSMITKIYAIDEDSGMNSDITYQIIATKPALESPFQIDQQSGNITLVQHLRGEDHGMHHLFIVVRDGGRPGPLQTAVWVNLLVNETLEKCQVNAVPDYSPPRLPPPMPVRDRRCESNAWLVFYCGLCLMAISVCVLLAVVVVFMKRRKTKRKVEKKNVWETGNLCEMKPLN